jgi:hypothetical protein
MDTTTAFATTAGACAFIATVRLSEPVSAAPELSRNSSRLVDRQARPRVGSQQPSPARTQARGPVGANLRR